MNIFISGHKDLTKEEFEQYYIPLIDQGIYNNAKFYISNYGNCDRFSYDYFKLCEYYNVEICFNRLGFSNIDDKFIKAVGFKSDEEMYCYMTNKTNKDIAWIRNEVKLTTTGKNILRRFKMIQ